VLLLVGVLLGKCVQVDLLGKNASQLLLLLERNHVFV
jgi:hypothetical protein